MSRFIQKLPGIFVILFLLNLLVHLPFLNLPPSGAHVWRQCNTLAMSRNFLNENEGILKPKIDRRNESNGITGSHFPLYEYLLSGLYRIFGEKDWVSRAFSLINLTLSSFCIFLILLHSGIDRNRSLIAAALFSSVPQLYYDGINAMPDNLALCLSLYSLYFIMRQKAVTRYREVILSFFLGALGGMIKFQFLILPFAGLALHTGDWKNKKSLFIAALLMLLPVFAWYKYALYLTDLNNLREFGLWIKAVSVEEKLSTLLGNLSSDLPELVIGWPLFLAMFYFIRKKGGQADLIKISLLGIAGFIVFYVIAIERMRHHSYYFMALIPFLVLIPTASERFRTVKLSWLIVLLVLNYTWSAIRIIPSRWTEGQSGIPEEFSDPLLRSRLEKAVPNGQKVLTGPDVSGCIYFYFSKTKGYSFEDPNELLSQKAEGPFMKILEDAGVRYIIHNDTLRLNPVMSRLKDWSFKEQIGGFKVWELKR